VLIGAVAGAVLALTVGGGIVDGGIVGGGIVGAVVELTPVVMPTDVGGPVAAGFDSPPHVAVMRTLGNNAVQYIER
jgi:hypothetical protein